MSAVATDVRGHWAAPWILPVTQAGVMDVYPNHTFQPATRSGGPTWRASVSQLLAVISSERQIDLASWRSARPAFPDLPPTNVYYPSAALAVASGAMTPVEGERFAPTAPATGAERRRGNHSPPATRGRRP